MRLEAHVRYIRFSARGFASQDLVQGLGGPATLSWGRGSPESPSKLRFARALAPIPRDRERERERERVRESERERERERERE